MKRDAALFTFAMGIAGTIGVFVTQSQLDSRTVVFFRCLIAALTLGVYCWYKGLFQPAYFQRREVRLVVMGGITLVINWVLIFEAFKLASITIGIVSYYTEPFFLIALGMILLKERQRLSALGWTAVAFVGLLMIILANPVAPTSTMLSGVILAIGAASIFALATILGKQVVTMPSALVTFIQMVIGTVMLFPLSDPGSALSGRVPVSWGYVLALGTVHTAFLYLIFYQSVRRVPTGLMAPLSFIDPLITILSDVVVYKTALTPIQIVGIAAILLSAYFVSKPPKPQPVLQGA